MSESFTINAGYIVAEVDLHTNGIYGTGRAEFPLLVVCLQFTLRAHKALGCGLEFRELHCRLSPFDQTHIAVSLPSHMGVRLMPEQELSNHLVNVEIPLDRQRIALINRLRNGGDVKLRLDFELLIDEVVQINKSDGRPATAIWAHRLRHRAQSKLGVTIARSKWLGQVLEGTQFAKVHIIELPAIPIESCAAMKAAFDALQQAQKLESEGYYDEAVGKCRVALEPFCESVDKPDGKGGVKKVQKLKAAWQTRLAQRTYDWLDSSFAAVKQAANQSHHLSSSSYGQLEAQMLLMVTTALLSYATKVRQDP